jgi:hypothetical protein
MFLLVGDGERDCIVIFFAETEGSNRLTGLLSLDLAALIIDPWGAFGGKRSRRTTGRFSLDLAALIIEVVDSINYSCY